MSFSSNETIPSLRIKNVFHEAFRFLFTQPPQFWIGCSSLVAIFTSFNLFENYAQHLQDPPKTTRQIVTFLTSFLWLIKILLFCRLAIVCHRIIILRETIEHWLDFYHWSTREKEFAIRATLLYIALNIIAGIQPAFPMLGLISIMKLLNLDTLVIHDVDNFHFRIIGSYIYLLSIYPICRISLILPSLAADDSLSTSWVWDLSQGNGWRLTHLTGIIPCIFFLCDHPKNNIWGMFPSLPLNIQFFIENTWIGFLGLFHFTLLSITYQRLISHERSRNIPTSSPMT